MKKASATTGEMTVKIDLFGEEPRPDAAVTRDDRRIRPRGYRKLHGHRAEEAIAISEKPAAIPLEEGVSISTPNLFSYWLLKLFALRDRHERGQSEYAMEHVYDLYALWAATDEVGWDEAEETAARYADHPKVIEAGEIVADLFDDFEAPGTLLLRRALADRGIEVDRGLIGSFANDLRELLPAPVS